MKQRKIIFLIIFILTLSFLLCGCSEKDISEDEWNEVFNESNFTNIKINVEGVDKTFGEKIEYTFIAESDDNIVHVKYDAYTTDGELCDSNERYYFEDGDGIVWEYWLNDEEKWEKTKSELEISDFYFTYGIGDDYELYEYNFISECYVYKEDGYKLKVKIEDGVLTEIISIYKEFSCYEKAAFNYSNRGEIELELPSEDLVVEKEVNE